MKKKLSVILCAALVLSALCAALLTACNDQPKEPAVYTLDPDRDFGLYWYNDEGEKMLSEADMPVEFYDPEKPTVVYSHGWKMKPVLRFCSSSKISIISTPAFWVSWPNQKGVFSKVESSSSSPVEKEETFFRFFSVFR